MKKKIIACVTLIIMTTMLICSSVMAFDANDYDDDSWGGIDWNNNDWGDNDWDGSDGIIGGLSCLSVFFPSPIIIIIIILLVTRRNRSGTVHTSAPPQTYQMAGNTVLPNRNDEIQNIIKKKDPNFTADDFVTYAKQVYIDIQAAWCSRDMSSVEPVMSKNLFSSSGRMVQDIKARGIVYHYESIAINTAYLTSYIRDKENEYLTVYLNARMFSYQVDEKTGNIISGNKTSRVDIRYKMKFVRSNSSSTKSAVKGAQGYNCPNCGAPLEITSSGGCPYCGSIVNIGDYSWLLSDFITVQGNVSDEGIRVPPEDLK